MMIDNPRVFIAHTLYPHPVRADGTVAVLHNATTRYDARCLYHPCGKSLLAKTFNIAWATALQMQEQGEIDLFAMCHGDIMPDAGWLDVLRDEMAATGSHLVSVVSPIKDGRALTSCAVDLDDSRYHVRRLTLHEVHNDLPETFTTADLVAAGITAPDRPLLFNTGLWLADLSWPGFHATVNGELRLKFAMRDRIVRWPDGRLCAETESEDWYFSRELAAAGGRYCVTSKVGLDHYGEFAFGNRTAWGTVEHEITSDVTAAAMEAERSRQATHGQPSPGGNGRRPRAQPVLI
jgi:hypothetical protein